MSTAASVKAETRPAADPSLTRKSARELAQHDYDPESVTPDADKAHYRKPQF